MLFNPGLGHPRLAEGWLPSVSAALAWGRPLLSTSFDAEDCAADSRAIENAGVPLRWLQTPHENPVGSLKLEPQTQAGGGFDRLVRSNHSAFMVQSSAPPQ